jgi:hypothetical protein
MALFHILDNLERLVTENADLKIIIPIAKDLSNFIQTQVLYSS